MNARHFTMALLMSALPFFALAESAGITLNKGDFVTAEKISRGGETIVSVKLSKSGKAKFKKLNTNSVNEKVHTEIGGVVSDFTLREPIQGEGLEIGPYSAEEARRVMEGINGK